MPTVTPITSVRALLDAVDLAAAKVAVEAILPETIPVDGLALADTSGVAITPPVGTVVVLGADADGNPVLHLTGGPVGGVPYLPVDPFAKRGAISNTNFAASKEIEIAAFPITALQAVVGSRFKLSGKLEVFLNGTQPPPVLHIGVTTRSVIADDLGGLGGFPARLGYLCGFEYATTSVDSLYFTINEEFELADSTPNFVLSFLSVLVKAITLAGATFGKDSKVAGDASNTGYDSGLIGESTEELVLVIQSAAAAGTDCAMYVTYDLKMVQTV